MNDEFNPDEMEVFDHYIKRERQIARQKKIDEINREYRKQSPREAIKPEDRKCESYI